ncbi:MAG TPA: ATP-binding protein [Chloroflexota bacterium]|nr:ATP-binding protein [Chloroflexota bacterium]
MKAQPAPAAPAGRSRKSLFGSLHTRLLAAFVLVILVTLISAGVGVLWLIQEYQRRLAVDRLSEVAVAASLLGRQLEVQGARPAEIGDVLASQLTAPQPQSVRVLVIDTQDRVLVERPTTSEEAEDGFDGHVLRLPAPGDRASATGRPLFFRWRTQVWTEVAGSPPRPYPFIAAPLAPPGTGNQPEPAAPPAPDGRAEGRTDGQGRTDATERTPRAPRPAQAYRVVLAIPERSLADAWRELAPGLALAALIAVPVSIGVALLLSRSITRPLRRITRAAEDMARGDLRQEIPVQGSDEVAQLATSFNRMSREVERSQQSLRDFLADASHELRTPLTSIQGFSQALLDGTLAADAGGAVEAGQIINEESQRMRRLVEDLLYLSRVESLDVTAAESPVDVAALLREAWRRLQLTAEQRDLRIALSVPDLPPVSGDADQIDRLFGNLLENAGKYTPNGGRIDVAGRVAGGALVVTVHNSGSVIPAEDLPHVFERFYRVDKSRAREVEGSGLGLAIAQEVAQRHRGRIEVASGARTGTTFTVTLPLGQAPAPAGRRRPAGPAAGPAQPAPAAYA